MSVIMPRPATDQQWTPKRRGALVLAILKGEFSASEAADRYGLTVDEIERWVSCFLRGGERALRVDSGSPAAVWRRPAYAASVLLILAVWIGLRIAYWNGYYVEDSPGYVTDAIWAATGNYHARDHVNGLNVGTYLPVAIPIAIFGKSEVALSVWPLFCSLLGMVSLGVAAGLLLGPRSALVAAFLYATYPGDIFFSTIVMPDAIQAGWWTLSICLVVWAIAVGPHRRRMLLLFAGVAAGCCHLIRANDVVLVPVGIAAIVVLSTIWKQEPLRVAVRECAYYITGLALVIALEGICYLWATGDFLHRLHVVMRHYGTTDSIRQWGLNTDPWTIPFSIFPPVLWWKLGGWGSLNHEQGYHALTFCLAAVSIVIGALAVASGWALPKGGSHTNVGHTNVGESRVSARTRAGFVLGVLWFAWPLLYHQFGSQSLTQFVPIHRLSRHLVVYAPGALFAIVAGLCAVVEAFGGRAMARRAMLGSGTAILLIDLGYGWSGVRITHAAYQDIKQTYVRIRDHLPGDVRTIVADPGDLSFFDFWLNPLGSERVKLRAFASYSTCDELKEGVVLTQSNPGWHGLGAAVIRETVERLPCLMDIPETWHLLYDGYPERVFLIDAAQQTLR
jgi:4-amino-4-deoxy-L-arabinose transferase-like glycosyltransferase